MLCNSTFHVLSLKWGSNWMVNWWGNSERYLIPLNISNFLLVFPPQLSRTPGRMCSVQCVILKTRRTHCSISQPVFHLILLFSFISPVLSDFLFFAIIVVTFLRSLYILYILQSTAIASSGCACCSCAFLPFIQFAKCSCCLLRFLNDYWLKFIIVVVSFVSFITGNEFLNDVLFYSLWNNLNFLLSEDMYVRYMHVFLSHRFHLWFIVTVFCGG